VIFSLHNSLTFLKNFVKNISDLLARTFSIHSFITIQP